MECLLGSSMKLAILAAWLSILLFPCRFSDICKKCHQNASCETGNASHFCLCNHGYTGDGINFCSDDDECQNVTDICDKNANCTNTPGSYYCECEPGFKSTGQERFQTNDDTRCVDDDECEKNNICNKNATCINTPGSYYCQCESGFKSTGQERFQTNENIRCVDINECENSKICGPFSHCHNTPGSYFCTCQRGYDPTSETMRFQGTNGVHCKESPKKNCHLDETCVSEIVKKITQNVSNTTKPLQLLEEMNKDTSRDLSPVDIISYVEVLSHIVPKVMNNAGDDSATNETMKEFISTVGNLVEKDELVAWNAIRKEEKEKTLTKLLHTVEEAALDLSKHYKTGAEVEIKRDNIALKVYALDAQEAKKLNVHANVGGDTIQLTPKQTDANGNVSIVFLHYNSIGDLMGNTESGPLQDTEQFSDADKFVVHSQVIAAAINPPSIYQLDHVKFSLEHTTIIDSKLHVTTCAFWKYSPMDMRGYWATEGCTRTHVTRTHTNCSCDHLTHFAILMSSGRADLSADVNILTRITQLGMIISIICLSMCIFTFWFFSEIQSTRTTIHKNLCCSLFMAEFIFLVGINMSTHKLFCSIVAMLLHYFFLAAFAWMCIEGIHLYLIVVGVIYNKGFLHRNFYIFGYGSPAVVVGISATLGYRYYGTSTACWLSTENNFIWSFIGPACLIILVNLLAFGVIIYKVYRHTAIKKPEISHYENIRSCARGAIALMFVLGATWTFGVLHILQETTTTAYLFTISNAFQGMFIFIFLCVLSRKIQEEYYRLFKNVPCCFEYLR